MKLTKVNLKKGDKVKFSLKHGKYAGKILDLYSTRVGGRMDGFAPVARISVVGKKYTENTGRRVTSITLNKLVKI